MFFQDRISGLSIAACNLCHFQSTDISGYGSLRNLKTGLIQSCRKFFLCIDLVLTDQFDNFFMSCYFQN